MMKIYYSILTLLSAIQLQTILCEATTSNVYYLAKESNEDFALKLTAAAGLLNARNNVIISPLLIQSSLTLLYYGSRDETAASLRNGLYLKKFTNKQHALTKLSELYIAITSNSNNNNNKGDICLANAYYMQKHLTVGFNDDIKQKAQLFDIKLEQLSLDKREEETVQAVNNWFQAQTDNKINNIISSALLNEQQELMLLSAAAFKSSWAQAFDAKETEKLNFYTTDGSYKAVDSMFVAHKFKYAEFEDLDAKAIELPFKGSYFKMLILHPNKIDGLAALETKLKTKELSELLAVLQERKIALTLPKFHIESNTDMRAILSNLGLEDIFHSSAKIDNIFHTLLPLTSTPSLTRMQHKAALEINETGESSRSGFSLSGLFNRQLQLVINHGFYFVIRTDEAVVMAGHIVNL